MVGGEESSDQQQGVTQQTLIRREDSELGLVGPEEEKLAIVSPKSSMISSRMAEPETADLWAN